jgi:hypothetical protein
MNVKAFADFQRTGRTALAPQIDRRAANLRNSAGLMSPKAQQWESWAKGGGSAHQQGIPDRLLEVIMCALDRPVLMGNARLLRLGAMP